MSNKFWKFSNPVLFKKLANLISPLAGIIAILAIIPGFVWGVFFTSPDYKQMETVKIIFIHVPAAFLAINIYLMMTRFGAGLWLDGRVWNSGYLTSWDLYPITQRFAEPARLQAYANSSAEPTESHSVRGGSTAYLEWSPPSSHAPTSLRIRTPDGDELPDVMGMWIFRIQ